MNDQSQDEEYQEFLRSKQQKKLTHEEIDEKSDRILSEQYRKTYAPGGESRATYVPHSEERGSRQSRDVSPQRKGSAWDRTKQQGDVVATLQRSYVGKDRQKWYNGQLRLVVKEFKGNQFIALENWKPCAGEEDRDVKDQLHEWKGAANIQVKELRTLASCISGLADQMDGGESQ